MQYFIKKSCFFLVLIVLIIACGSDKKNSPGPVKQSDPSEIDFIPLTDVSPIQYTDSRSISFEDFKNLMNEHRAQWQHLEVGMRWQEETEGTVKLEVEKGRVICHKKSSTIYTVLTIDKASDNVEILEETDRQFLTPECDMFNGKTRFRSKHQYILSEINELDLEKIQNDKNIANLQFEIRQSAGKNLIWIKYNYESESDIVEIYIDPLQPWIAGPMNLKLYAKNYLVRYIARSIMLPTVDIKTLDLSDL